MAMNKQRKTGNILNIVSYDTSGNVTLPAAIAAGSLHDAAYTRFVKPTGGTYVAAASTATGAIAITLPVGKSGSMLRVTIKVYLYATNQSFEIHAGGYDYDNAGTQTWANNPYAYIVGNPGVDRRFNVRFGYNTSTNKAIIYIGELNTVWSYPQVWVTEIQAGFGGMNSNWLNTCTVAFEASAFQNVTTTISNAQVGYAVSTNTANAVVLRDASGNFSAGTITATLSGNATSATNLSTTRTNWSTNGTITAVVGQLAWRHYGNNHTIFDASNSLSPDGTTVNNTNPTTNWTATYPTLMGWNGTQTYGVRVDSARLADNSSAVQGLTVSQLFNNMGDNHATRPSFDASTASYGFGFRFIQGSTNGPGTGGSQFYSLYIGLGNDYPATGATSYGLMLAVDRNVTTPYLSVRYNENNVLSTWRRISAGYADNAGTLGGLALQSASTAPSANQVLRSDASGYSFFTYINSNTSNLENPTVSQVIVTNGSDNYYRKAGIVHLSNAVRSNASGDWAINISGSANTLAGVGLSRVVYGDNANKTTNVANFNTTLASGFYDNNAGTGTPTATWYHFINSRHTDTGSHYAMQFAGEFFNSDNLFYRTINNGSIGAWCKMWHGNNMDAPNRKTNASNYYDVNTWLSMNGSHGMYWPSTNGAHFQANVTSTYGQFSVSGSRGTYSGIYDTYSGVNILMFDASANGGVYRESNARWYWYYNASNDCMGIAGSTTSASYKLYVNGAAYVAGAIVASGDITAFSDERVKENISTVSNSLDIVTKLRGVSYTRKDDQTAERKVGLIAQEVLQVLPEVVKEGDDGMYSVAYGNIVGVLVEAIKEQQVKIDELQQQINFLAENR